MAGSTDDDGCVDGVGIHAGLVVVVHGDECPVCYDSCNAYDAGGVSRASDEVFNGRSVEQFDVGEGEYTREES